MAITDIFSKRQKISRGEMPDVYIYDKLPNPLKIQIWGIWKDIDDDDYITSRINRYKHIVRILRREYGLFLLSEPNPNSDNYPYHTEFENFFFAETEVGKALDAVELFFRSASHVNIFNNAVKELNFRFKEHGVGYQYESRQIIRIDSQFIHTEVVRPALQLLSDKHYAGAEQEFLKAHEHYRNGNAKEVLNECLKSFESVMKAICQKRKWSYSNNATSKTLIQVCLKNGLIPQFWQKHYSSLEDLLRSSVPTARNKLSGHGQGSDIKSVPDYLVAYMLHMTASAIVFLVEAEKNL